MTTQPLRFRTATQVLTDRAHALFASTKHPRERRSIWSAGYLDAVQGHAPTIDQPDLSDNAAAYCDGYEQGKRPAVPTHCPDCGAEMHDGLCDFCPSRCPACNTALDFDAQDNPICPNEDCPANRERESDKLYRNDPDISAARACNIMAERDARRRQEAM